ncbi:hypothetical protein [Asticcacaulis sp. EMRT-3]|uniref:SEL1-like repeat protein n=1 Tax=Asticcacaulis sp. EMRT-3 TaxID=3040349 RepID=UPI0024AEE645|nr:hypothetical protein [Asticcacaulis sp. EMRT-3]MDI7775457.1 hypothetical protein [Asticcacaulis sp. EMRT-3]
MARRSGMTLGEWLNQMILEGRDVGALIDSARGRRVPETGYGADYDEDDEIEPYAPPRRQASSGRPAPYSTGAKPYAAPYAAKTSPLTSRDLRRRSIFDDQSERAHSGRAHSGNDDSGGDLGRVARVLETLGERLENSESRSAGAVRSVSSAVEALLGRLERSEAAHAETRDELHERIEEQSQAAFERLSRAEADTGLFAERLQQAERLIDAQAERLEGLSGHVREERERVARLETQAKNAPVAETVQAVENALGKLANQLYEGEARARDTLSGVREDMVGLSHRLGQMEMRDPEAAAQGLIDKVVAQLAQRLEAAEAQTSGAIRNLEQAFQLLEGRLNRAEERGDVTDPEAVRSLTGLAADLSRRVTESRQEWRQAIEIGRQQTLEEALSAVDARIGTSEKRSAAAIETMGQDVLRIADHLNRRMGSVEKASQDGLSRFGREMQHMAETLDSRFARTDQSQAQALERLGGEIARISERLNAKLSESERRTTEVLGSVGEQVAQQRDHMREDLAERIRQSEARTAKLLEDTRARIDEKLARVQTENLLSEAATRQTPSSGDDDGLPSPFGGHAFAAPASFTAKRPFTQAEAEPAIETSAPVKATMPEAQSLAAEEDSIDLTGHLLDRVTDFKPEFDPFEEEDLEADLVAPQPASPAVSQPIATPAPQSLIPDEDDDSDPFADIDTSHKTAPQNTRQDARHEPVFAEYMQAEADLSLPDADADADGRENGEAPVSMTTRDALAAARAAVRASIEGHDERNLLGSLKSGMSRRQAAPAAKDKKGEKGGNTLMNALKASSLAGALVVAGTTGYLAVKNTSPDKPKAGASLAAAAVDVTSDAAADAQNQQNLKTRYDVALQALDARAPGAVETLKAVANQGYAPAQYHLSLIYNGQGHLVPADKTEARLWTQRAAEGGIAAAMYNLGSMYYQGEGGSQDHSLAAMWFRKAAERGVKDSQYNLGVLYERGDGVPLNPSEAYKWLRIAGNSGDKVSAQEADDLASQLTAEQRQRAEDAVTRFTPVSDGQPPMPASES